MDNDNLLVQKAADLYRGLRFKMKYRGVPILSAGAGNDLARDLLESGQPFLFGRCGATEMRTAADYLHNGGRPFADRTRADIRNRRMTPRWSSSASSISAPPRAPSCSRSGM